MSRNSANHAGSSASSFYTLPLETLNTHIEMCIIKSRHLKLGVYFSKINYVYYATETSWLNRRTLRILQGKERVGTCSSLQHLNSKVKL